jgi:hypothetical protein
MLCPALPCPALFCLALCVGVGVCGRVRGGGGRLLALLWPKAVIRHFFALLCAACPAADVDRQEPYRAFSTWHPGTQAPRHSGTTLTLTLTHNDMTTTCVTARSVVTGKTSSLHFALPAAASPHDPLPPCLALLCLALPCRGAVVAALSRLHHPQLRTRPEPTWTSSLTMAASAPIQARRARLASACIRCCSIALLSASLFYPARHLPGHPATQPVRMLMLMSWQSIQPRPGPPSWRP